MRAREKALADGLTPEVVEEAVATGVANAERRIAGFKQQAEEGS